MQEGKASFAWDQTTQYAGSFAVEGTKITMLKEDEMPYQITSLHPLPHHSTTTFRLITYGTDSVICFGIITAKRKQERESGGGRGDHN